MDNSNYECDKETPISVDMFHKDYKINTDFNIDKYDQITKEILYDSVRIYIYK